VPQIGALDSIMLIDHRALLAAIRESLYAITELRLFETERGYQGALIVELSKRLPNLEVSKQGALVEQEYQKKSRTHGLTIRPDIIIHAPFDQRLHTARTEGNFAVFELKRRASATKAEADFQNLLSMMRILQYPLGVFVNIDSKETHFAQMPDVAIGHLVAFAVSLKDGSVFLVEKETYPAPEPRAVKGN
jgi:hypothetical protein